VVEVPELLFFPTGEPIFSFIHPKVQYHQKELFFQNDHNAMLCGVGWLKEGRPGSDICENFYPVLGIRTLNQRLAP